MQDLKLCLKFKCVIYRQLHMLKGLESYFLGSLGPGRSNL